MSQEVADIPVAVAHLTALRERVAVPTYVASDLRRSIVHVGVGGFHRAHLATYVDDLAQLGNTDWGIVGVGLLPSDSHMASVLSDQDNMYTLISRSADTTDVQVIGSIVDFVFAADDSSAFVELVASDTTQIVSMTITEGGYPVDDATGEFVPSRSPDNGTFAMLVRGLDQRRVAGAGGITVMSCDNIMTNGEVAQTATLGEAARLSPELVEWIRQHVSFPNSMVDRITPATKPTDIEWLHHEFGINDRWPVVAEPFRQWVVEDRFAADRLPLDDLDVIVTDDIEPYELMKLRLLNAGHSCLAYLAALRGYELVDQAMADTELRSFVASLLHNEAKPTLAAAPGIDLDEYIASLFERFSNPAVGDQIARLCLDGTAKFPKFLLPSVSAQLDAGGEIARSALALAGWCEYLATFDAPSADPQLDVAVAAARDSLDRPEAFLEIPGVFGELATDDRFVEAFTVALKSIRTHGVGSAVSQLA